MMHTMDSSFYIKNRRGGGGGGAQELIQCLLGEEATQTEIAKL